MQVDVKALLADATAYKRVLTALSDHYVCEDTQENHFLDTPAREFFAQGTILRVRLFVRPDSTSHAVQQQHADKMNAKQYSSAKLMIKQHAHVEDGSQVSWTSEEVIPVDVALSILQCPRQIYDFLSSIRSSSATTDVILNKLEKEYPRSHLESLQYVGCFITLRMAFSFPQCTAQSGLRIHVDKTTYPFGDRFEVEVVNITVPVHDVSDELAQFLTQAGAAFEFAEESKFQRFAHGMEASRAKSHMVQEVKLVLANSEDLNKVASSLQSSFVSEQLQENFFYDGFDDELASRGAFFRLRRVNHHTFSVVLKEHQDVDSGSQLNWTQETELSPDVAHALMHDPTSFLQQGNGNAISLALREKFQVQRLRSIGVFTTQRQCFSWVESQSQPQGGLQIRLDLTKFPFGEHYEVEVANIAVPVSDVLAELQTVLQAMNVSFRVATESKLDCFLRGLGTR